MHEYPYGGEQQLNLNWIISEIIKIHKTLDPDYVAPTFDNTFPFTNLNALNLDWILKELRTIKDLAPTEDANILKMVANALLALSYNPDNIYNSGDIAYIDTYNRLGICNDDGVTGVWDGSKWDELRVGEALTWLLTTPAATSSDNVSNNSNITGATVTDVLNVLSYCRWVGEFDNATDIISQIDALPDTGVYFGRIASPSTSYFPSPTSGVVYAYVYSAGYKTLYYIPNGTGEEIYMRKKSSTWRTWSLLPTRNEVDTISTNIGALTTTVNSCKWVGAFDNATDIRTQVDALPDTGAYFGQITSPSTSYFPTTTNGFVYVYSNTSGQKTVYYIPNGASDAVYMLRKQSTWRNWIVLPQRSDITTIQTNIASVETGTTASRAYSVGEYVTVDGILYIVSSAIANGATFTVGTNITAVKVTDALTPTQITVSAETGVTIVNQKVYKVGKIVVVSISFSNASAIASNTDLITGFPPTAALTWAIGIETVNAAVNEGFNFRATGALQHSGALPAGSWLITATYITT